MATAVKKAATKSPASKGSSRNNGKVAGDGGSAKGKAWTFPKNTLEDAIRIPKALDDKFAGNPTPANDVARAVGYSAATDWRFAELLRAANLYGLVSGSGASATVSLTPLGQDIVTPQVPLQRAEGLVRAFRSVDEFKRVEEYYGGKKIPEDEFFTNTLIREFNIPKDRVQTFTEIFLENVNYLRSFSPYRHGDIDGTTKEQPSANEVPNTPSAVGSPETLQSDTRVREFLDSCFVMMPFGHWQDKYYQEIYIPAIKEAGLEPVRGDELYHTGSVVEQIWEQITKAKLLVADLSGRNANVFYELGLAHAAAKPVVFTVSSIDDVPFDLRHLRVIVYDVREPGWSLQLRKTMTDYLRNAAREPSKSIPSTFRSLAEE